MLRFGGLNGRFVKTGLPWQSRVGIDSTNGWHLMEAFLSKNSMSYEVLQGKVLFSGGKTVCRKILGPTEGSPCFI